MKQLQFEYTSDIEFKKEVTKISKWCENHIATHVVFRVFTETLDEQKIRDIYAIIESIMPNALYYGCSTNGNIMNGTFKKNDTTVTCTIFEYTTTKIKLVQYKLTANNYKETTQALKEEVDNNPWVTAVELLTTIRGMSMTGFCEELSSIREGVAVFGGGAFSEDMNENEACVFSKDYGYSEKSVVFLLMGGPDFYVNTSYLTGWKPLGRELLVTRAEGSTLYELDHKPAFETYYRYLRIKNDDNFFLNTLEFPFIYKLNDSYILRAPTASTKDGALIMTSDIDENVKARIAYGDPWTILNSVNEKAEELKKFQPEVINIFSCAARRTYWGDDEAGKETEPFQELASTSGFYTSGEFLRTDGIVNQHNVTLVVAALREGEIDTSKIVDEGATPYKLSGKVSMINRLATFIEAATEELEEANRQLDRSSKTDGLTQLYNRIEIQRRIIESTKAEEAVDAEGKTYLIMMDIDNFKRVNDTYGHNEGDDVLRGLSAMIKDTMKKIAKDADAGRWGGEEFMILVPNTNLEKACELAEKVRSNFAAMDFNAAGHCTISLGVAGHMPGESVDVLCTRVDGALYEAKNSGKNRVVVANG